MEISLQKGLKTTLSLAPLSFCVHPGLRAGLSQRFWEILFQAMKKPKQQPMK
jgi:hypothetical protein